MQTQPFLVANIEISHRIVEPLVQPSGAAMSLDKALLSDSLLELEALEVKCPSFDFMIWLSA